MKRIILQIIIIGALLNLACTTKVSEWVLLNSQADKYLLVYFHENDISDIENKHLTEIKNTLLPDNCQIKNMQRKGVKKPYFALYFNNRPIFERIDKDQLEDVIFSPLRQSITNELMSGKLCVMLYLKSGNMEKDDEGYEVVNESVKASPFADIVSIVELDRNSTKENRLVSLLLNVEDDLKEINEPMLFGIFGKMRALEPLLSKGISSENIKLMIDFLTADCSCLIKDDLPGVNILNNGKWQNPQSALVNKIIDANPYLEHK